MWGSMVGNQWNPGTGMSKCRHQTIVGNCQAERGGGGSGIRSFAMPPAGDATKGNWEAVQQESGERPGEGAVDGEAREGQQEEWSLQR